MSAEENKAIITNLIEELNRGNTAPYNRAIEPDCEIMYWTGESMDKKSFIEFINTVTETHPDFKIAIEDIIASNDKVVVRYTESAVVKGSFIGMEPNKKRYSLPAIEIYRLSNGKINGLWMA